MFAVNLRLCMLDSNKVDPFVKTRFLNVSLFGHLAVKESWNTAA